VTADFVNEHLSELGSGCTGRDEYRRRLPQFLSTFVGARYTVVTLAETAATSAGGNGDVVVRYRFQATYEGTPIDIPGLMWFEVRDGLIAHRTDLWDSLTFLRQTGQAD
jgi:ketosteroid isomerase-like protein